MDISNFLGFGGGENGRSVRAGGKRVSFLSKKEGPKRGGLSEEEAGRVNTGGGGMSARTILFRG